MQNILDWEKNKDNLNGKYRQVILAEKLISMAIKYDKMENKFLILSILIIKQTNIAYRV